MWRPHRLGVYMKGRKVHSDESSLPRAAGKLEYKTRSEDFSNNRRYSVISKNKEKSSATYQAFQDPLGTSAFVQNILKEDSRVEMTVIDLFMSLKKAKNRLDVLVQSNNDIIKRIAELSQESLGIREEYKGLVANMLIFMDQLDALEKTYTTAARENCLKKENIMCECVDQVLEVDKELEEKDSINLSTVYDSTESFAPPIDSESGCLEEKVVKEVYNESIKLKESCSECMAVRKLEKNYERTCVCGRGETVSGVSHCQICGKLRITHDDATESVWERKKRKSQETQGTYDGNLDVCLVCGRDKDTGADNVKTRCLSCLESMIVSAVILEQIPLARDILQWNNLSLTPEVFRDGLISSSIHYKDEYDPSGFFVDLCYPDVGLERKESKTTLVEAKKSITCELLVDDSLKIEDPVSGCLVEDLDQDISLRNNQQTFLIKVHVLKAKVDEEKHQNFSVTAEESGNARSECECGVEEEDKWEIKRAGEDTVSEDGESIFEEARSQFDPSEWPGGSVPVFAQLTTAKSRIDNAMPVWVGKLADHIKSQVKKLNSTLFNNEVVITNQVCVTSDNFFKIGALEFIVTTDSPTGEFDVTVKQFKDYSRALRTTIKTIKPLIFEVIKCLPNYYVEEILPKTVTTREKLGEESSPDEMILEEKKSGDIVKRNSNKESKDFVILIQVEVENGEDSFNLKDIYEACKSSPQRIFDSEDLKELFHLLSNGGVIKLENKDSEQFYRMWKGVRSIDLHEEYEVSETVGVAMQESEGPSPPPTQENPGASFEELEEGIFIFQDEDSEVPLERKAGELLPNIIAVDEKVEDQHKIRETSRPFVWLRNPEKVELLLPQTPVDQTCRSEITIPEVLKYEPLNNTGNAELNRALTLIREIETDVVNVQLSDAILILPLLESELRRHLQMKMLGMTDSIDVFFSSFDHMEETSEDDQTTTSEVRLENLLRLLSNLEEAIKSNECSKETIDVNHYNSSKIYKLLHALTDSIKGLEENATVTNLTETLEIASQLDTAVREYDTIVKKQPSDYFEPEMHYVHKKSGKNKSEKDENALSREDEEIVEKHLKNLRKKIFETAEEEATRTEVRIERNFDWINRLERENDEAMNFVEAFLVKSLRRASEFEILQRELKKLSKAMGQIYEDVVKSIEKLLHYKKSIRSSLMKENKKEVITQETQVEKTDNEELLIKKDETEDKGRVKFEEDDRGNVKTETIKERGNVKTETIKEGENIKTETIKEGGNVKTETIKEGVNVKTETIKEGVNVKTETIKEGVNVKTETIKEEGNVSEVKDETGRKVDTREQAVNVNTTEEDSKKETDSVQMTKVEDSKEESSDISKENAEVEAIQPEDVREVKKTVEIAKEDKGVQIIMEKSTVEQIFVEEDGKKQVENKSTMKLENDEQFKEKTTGEVKETERRRVEKVLLEEKKEVSVIIETEKEEKVMKEDDDEQIVKRDYNNEQIVTKKSFEQQTLKIEDNTDVIKQDTRKELVTAEENMKQIKESQEKLKVMENPKQDDVIYQGKDEREEMKQGDKEGSGGGEEKEQFQDTVSYLLRALDKLKKRAREKNEACREILNSIGDNSRKMETETVLRTFNPSFTTVSGDEVVSSVKDFRRIGENSLYMSWSKPEGLQADSFIGYEIHVNGRLNQKVRNPKRLQAVLYSVDLSRETEVQLFGLIEGEPKTLLAVVKYSDV